MPIPRIFLCACAGLLLSTLGPGCGPPKVVNSLENYQMATLEEVNDLYRSATGANNKPPASLKDLARNRDLFMNGYTALEKGEVVAYWGVTLTPGDDKGAGEEVLAYRSDAATQGGPVLMKDGTVKTLTADQFKAAKKAGKD